MSEKAKALRIPERDLVRALILVRNLRAQAISEDLDPRATRIALIYADLVDFMTSGPVCALVLEGKNAVEVTRTLMGSTNAGKAAPGTIRGDLGLSFSNNLVHGSDSKASAKREIALFFPVKKELLSWSPVTRPWVYASEELA